MQRRREAHFGRTAGVEDRVVPSEASCSGDSWDFNGIFVPISGEIRGRFVGYSWDFMGYLWDFNGMSWEVHGRFLGFLGIFVGFYGRLMGFNGISPLEMVIWRGRMGSWAIHWGVDGVLVGFHRIIIHFMGYYMILYPPVMTVTLCSLSHGPVEIL